MYLKKKSERGQHQESIIGVNWRNGYLHNLSTMERKRTSNQDCASSFQCFLTSENLTLHQENKNSQCGITLIRMRVTRQAVSWQAIPAQSELVEQQPTAVHGCHILGGLGAQETVTCFDSWLHKFDAVEKHQDSKPWDSTVGSGRVCGTGTASPSALFSPVYHIPCIIQRCTLKSPIWSCLA